MEDGVVGAMVQEHIEVAKALRADGKLVRDIGKFADAVVSAYAKGGKLIAMGNGGSAADAQHIAAEFLGKYLKERKAIPAISLTANSSAITAIANDYGYELVFRRQLEGWLGKNDIVLGISTSGNSPNVVSALEYAKKNGARTVALVGAKKCKLDGIADIVIKAPSDKTPRIQEMHILIAHIACELSENALAEKGVI